VLRLVAILHWCWAKTCVRVKRRGIGNPPTSYIGVLFTIRFRKICTMRNCEPRGRTGLDLAVRATGRAPSRTPLSQSASSPLDVKAFNLSTKVHQKGALPTVDLPSSTLQQLVHLSFMLDACREWLHRQEPLFMTCFSRGSSTASRVLRQGRAQTRW
jgi:hypothetical protein